MPVNPKKPDMKERGYGGVLMLNTLINSTEFNNDLKGKKGIKEFNKMRLDDATVNAALIAIFLPILSTHWRIDAASEKRSDTKIKEFVEDNLFNGMSKTWQETMQEILLYLPFGCMPFELVWEFNEEMQLRLRKLASRWPTTIEGWELKNKETGIVQQVDLKTVEIPIEKLVVFINNKEGDSWWGRSLLRPAYRNYYTKNKYYLIDAMAHERQGLGIPYAKKPIGAIKGDEEAMEELLSNIGANEEAFMLYPEDWEVGFMDMKAGTIKSPIDMINHHDRQILKNVLAQFIELGATDTGSYALSADHKQLFIQSLEAVANYIRDNIQNYVIKKMVDYNFPDVEEYPKLEYKKIGDVDLAVFTTALEKMVKNEIVKVDANTERIVRDHFDLPEIEGEDFDPEEMDAMLYDLENDPEEEMATEEVDENGEPIVTDEEVTEAHEYGIPGVIEAAKGKPLTEEHKRKISEALKKLKSLNKKPAKKTSKSASPEAKAKKEQMKKIHQEMKDYARTVRRDELERRAKGEKLDPQQKAKRELEVFEKKTEFEKKLEKLQSEYDALTATPAAAPAKASEGSNPLLLKFGEQLQKVINAVTNRPHTS